MDGFTACFAGLDDPRTGNAGQLAFPQHPFYRSPRDYFMWDER